MDDADAFAFGRFTLVPEQRELMADGASIPLSPRALDILICLIKNSASTVTKDALLAFAWPGRTIEENNLTVHISALRRTLGDGRDGTRFVQTVLGRGYRFVAPVSVIKANTGPRASPLTIPQTNLPQLATGFVGREIEMLEIKRRLTTHRLVTITGIGGMGKTRVALQVGAALLLDYADGIWLVDLGTITEPSLIVEAIGAAFHIGGVEASSEARLAGFLANRQMLLILDSCEHLISHIATLVGTILRFCARVTMLATSRESLAVDGESIYRLPPLPFPDVTHLVDAASALQHDSVRLFVDRASATVGDFVFDDTTAQIVARICRQLDGIALAIEMAAPRLQVLNLTQLADRLNERFRLLSAHSRTALPRHRTLRAVIDWSHDLLSEPERVLLRRLAVFAGGANLEAVVAVTAEDAPDDWDLLDLLMALVEKSLVVADVAGGEPRYRLLETTRQYALEKLTEASELGRRRSHAEHFATVFERAETEWPSTPTAHWLAAYAADTDNLRAALEWAFGPDGDTDVGARLAAGSYPLWWDLPHLPLQESRRWFDLAVPCINPETPPGVAARLWFGRSWRDVRFGDRENFPAAEQATALSRQINDPISLGAALWRAGSTLLTTETADIARVYFDEAESILRGQPPTKWLALCLVKQGDLRFRLGHLESALAAYEEAMQLARATSHWYGLMNGGSNMAELLFHLGQRDRALVQLRQLRDELLRGRRTPLMATLVAHLLLAGEVAEALETASEAIAYAWAIGLQGALAWTIEALALKLALDGDMEHAARLAGYARAVHQSVATRAGSRRAVFLQLNLMLTERLAEPLREQLLADGATWTEQKAAEQAAALCGAL